ncbi:DUF5069 domain-containing protein [Candidatus Latescibacterota bacterium]
MDLTKQPPRRPSNAGMAGIVALARMADKARAHNDELLGEFVYGEDSGLDCEVLEFLNMTPDEFAAAADELDDARLADLALEKAGREDSEIEAFNRAHLEKEPQDDRHRQLLVERVARYAPGRTDIRTVFQSIELDDWGAYRDLDLTTGPPRTPYLRSVVGAFAVARMADKARAAKTGKLGEYKYGPDSGLDRASLEELQLDAEAFLEAAYENPNDVELGEWIRRHGRVDGPRISAFNAGIVDFGVRTPGYEDRFRQRRDEVCPQRLEVETYFDLMDVDDQQSFGLVDLTRRPPRTPYDTSVGGIVGLARMIDKGRASLTRTLGLYWFGDDSGIDRQLLTFLGLSQAEFAEGLRQGATDEAVVAWLGDRLKKPRAEKLNARLRSYGPTTESQERYLRETVARCDGSRIEVGCYFAMMVLEDDIHFARLKAGV